METLAAELGETVKLVVRDGREALTVAAVIPRDACIASRVGTRLPLHVGASQRLLLAHAPAEIRDAVLASPLRPEHAAHHHVFRAAATGSSTRSPIVASSRATAKASTASGRRPR